MESHYSRNIYIITILLINTQINIIHTEYVTKVLLQILIV